MRETQRCGMQSLVRCVPRSQLGPVERGATTAYPTTKAEQVSYQDPSATELGD